MDGLSTRRTAGGVLVCRLHYSADPKKRPGTKDGDAWLAHALQGYPGGMQSARWRKEMEIDYGALGGTKLFPEWEIWCTQGKILIPPTPLVGYRIYASYDHGWRNPACYLLHGINSDGQIITFWEFYADHVPIPDIARIVLGEAVQLRDGRSFPGNPMAGEEVIRDADPAIWAEDQPLSDNTMKSVADLFRRYGVTFSPAERGGDTMVAEWLLGHYWRDPLKPLYQITTACPKLIWELGLQRHKQYSARVALHRDQPEALVDKDNHAWDALKYFLRRFPPRPTAQTLPDRPGTFLWWRKLAKQAKQGEAVQATYRREMIGEK